VSEEPLDLHTLLAQFVALRHEVNLQTKASRAQQEQNADALGSLAKALEALEQARAAPPADDKVRPLLKTLIDLHDNLSLALREVERTQEVLRPLLDQFAPRAPSHEPEDAAPEGEEQAADFILPDADASDAPQTAAAPPRRSWWARWFGGGPRQDANLRTVQEEAGRQRAREAANGVPRFVTSLITGYTMSLHRVERALEQFDLEAIPTIGLPFDPETMEVLEVVYEVGRTSTEVIEEVRRGYFWGGHVFRYAQVRVARSPSN